MGISAGDREVELKGERDWGRYCPISLDQEESFYLVLPQNSITSLQTNTNYSLFFVFFIFIELVIYKTVSYLTLS